MPLKATDTDDVAKRVKFQVEYQATVQAPHEMTEWLPLSRALEASEQVGAAPISEQGYIFGNGAILASTPSSSSIVVSKSGRRGDADGFGVDDFCRVVDFDASQWKATYGGCPGSTNSTNHSSNIIKPSSDTPLLWHALIVAPQKFGWKLAPKFVLHGHSCATDEDAKRLQTPISPENTMFSTQEDLKALMDLLEHNPYPQHQIFIRKGHGFFLLTQSSEEACRIVRDKLSSPEKVKEKDQDKENNDDQRSKKQRVD